MEGLEFNLKNLDFFSKTSFNSRSAFKGIKFITDFDFENKNVFLRLDLNISFNEESKKEDILNDLRFQKSLPSIQYLLKKKAKIIIASHRGRPQTSSDKKSLSLQPIATVLSECLRKEILFVEDPLGPATKILLSQLKPNQIIFLENLRFSQHEIENSPYLLNPILEYVHIYINDAFGVSHRRHGSVFGLPQRVKERGIGFLMKEEIEILEGILSFKTSEESLLAIILGGSKVGDKIELIENLMENKKGFLFLGGVMAYTFLKARGVFISSSLLEEEKIKFAKSLLKKFDLQGQKVFLPLDHKVKDGGKVLVTKGAEIREGQYGIDIGPKTIKFYEEELKKAKLIFWNGPMGIIEDKESREGTLKLVEALAENSAFTVIGGGESAKALQNSSFKSQINAISTGGGASLKYLQMGTLPGLEVLRRIE